MKGTAGSRSIRPWRTIVTYSVFRPGSVSKRPQFVIVRGDVLDHGLSGLFGEIDDAFEGGDMPSRPFYFF